MKIRDSSGLFRFTDFFLLIFPQLRSQYKTHAGENSVYTVQNQSQSCFTDLLSAFFHYRLCIRILALDFL